MHLGRYRFNRLGRSSYKSMTHKQRRQFRKLFKKHGMRAGSLRKYFRY